MEIETVAHRCFWSAQRLLERSKKGTKDEFFRPMLDIRADDGTPIALFTFISGFEDDDGETTATKHNWRDVMANCARMSMIGFARAEYVTLISDAYVKTEAMTKGARLEDTPDYPRGTFHRMYQQGDSSVSDALLVQAHSRTEHSSFSARYHVVKRRLIWDDQVINERDGFEQAGGYIFGALRGAMKDSRPLRAKIAGELGIPFEDVWPKLVEFMGGSEPTARAHQDMGVVRAFVSNPEFHEYVSLHYIPENFEASEIVEKSLRRMATEGIEGMEHMTQHAYKQFVNAFKQFDRRAYN